MAKDIVIKVKENDDRKVLFKLPYSIDVTLILNELNNGRFVISFELEELKEITKQNKEDKKYKELEHYREVIKSES